MPRPIPIAIALTLASLVGVASGVRAADDAAVESTETLARNNFEVWSCRFDDDWDVNYDLWPDRWTKLDDDEHPHYVRGVIEESDDPQRGRRLVLYPNGSSARASSPPIRVLPKFGYTLDLRVKTEHAEHGRAFVTIEFQDALGRRRQVEKTEALSTGGKWLDVSLKNTQPRDPSIDRMVLHFDFERGQRGDLRAEVSIADLRLLRLPSVRIRTGSSYNVYSNPDDVRVICELSGIEEKNPEVRFQLLDATNRSIGEAGVLELDGRVISEEKAEASEVLDGLSNSNTGYEGSREWRPPITDHGFYRVRVQLRSGQGGELLSEKAVTIAIVPEGLMTGQRGEFGWTLPDADRPLSFAQLQDLLPLAGVTLVKLPVWYPANDEKRGDQIVSFAEQLAARDVETVGLLMDPSELERNARATRQTAPIEGFIAAGHDHWGPAIEHVITKLSLRIHYWQLGADGDTSFVGYANLVQRLLDVRNAIFRFGQDVSIGIGWRWDHAVAWPERLSWDFEQMSSAKRLSAEELDKRLAESSRSGAERWVFVAPTTTRRDVGNEIERHERRVRDFVEQIIVAKVHGADAIFVADPFSGAADPAADKCGVMNVDGTPGELLLPWRTCARLLGGAEYLGAMTLPGGSKNWMFKRADGQVVMALWNERPTTEELYLGDDIRVVNVWGKTAKPEEAEWGQRIEVGRMPLFVVGLNEPVTAWRMAVEFQKDKVPSLFGSQHGNAVKFRNTFGQGVAGTARLYVPSRQATHSDAMTEADSSEWKITPRDFRYTLAAGREHQSPFQVTLNDASFGDQPVRVDFVVNADKPYRFSVWKSLRVGLGDLDLKVEVEIDPEGRLLVQQRLRAISGPPANFKCQVFLANTRRKRSQVFELGPNVDKKTYTYPNAAALVGKTIKLKIEEIDGSRVLVHRFVVPTLSEINQTAARKKAERAVTKAKSPDPESTAAL